MDDWEQMRLHAYHTERILIRSPFLSGLVPAASFHHERLDGSGYHRGVGAPSLDPMVRLLAAADAYQAMTEPRPYRDALSRQRPPRLLGGESRAGRLDLGGGRCCVGGRRTSRCPPWNGRPGLTEREIEVVRLLARGLQTKQVARPLQISTKTADYHIQNAYRKMGVSTRAGRDLVRHAARSHHLGELPIGVDR